MKDSERLFIKSLEDTRATLGLGDDCFVFNDYVIASDSFFEDVHFKIKWCNLYDIIEKAFLVNLSDIYATNATPVYAMLNISIPHNFRQIKELSNIIGSIALKHGVRIIGGDTIKDSKLQISLTLIGKLQKKPLLRWRIKRGDYMAYTSPFSALTKAKAQKFGKNISALKMALRYNYVKHNSRFSKPLLYPRMIFEINKIANAGMDISDGIFMDLQRLSSKNNVSFRFCKAIFEWFYSPEEYQMLYAISPKKLAKARNIAKKHRHKLEIFARVKIGRYTSKKRNWHS